MKVMKKESSVRRQHRSYSINAALRYVTCDGWLSALAFLVVLGEEFKNKTAVFLPPFLIFG